MTMRLLKPVSLECALRSPWRRALFLLVVALPACFLALQALRVAGASTLGESTDANTLRRALTLDPSNPALEHRLGLALFYAPGQRDLAGGLAHLRRATVLNPDEALYWLDLASACEASHDAAGADHSIGRALALSPLTPRVIWAAANYYLRAGRQERAQQLFRRLLILDPGYAAPVLQEAAQMLASPVSFEESLLGAPRNPQLALALVNFLSSRGDSAGAFAAWRRLSAASEARGAGGRPPFSYEAVAPYLDRLVAAGDGRELQSVWADLEREGVVAGGRAGGSLRGGAADPEPRLLIFNGGFEHPSVNSGLDWRYSPSPFISLDFSDLTAHSGSRALRVEFTGSRNDEVELISQFVPVAPRQRYALTAFVRSDAITSDSGPRLRVQDSLCRACLDVSGPSTLATTPWHPVSVMFVTGAETHLLKVSLWRARSRSYPSEIRGVLWLDDVSVAASGAPALPDGRPEARNLAYGNARP